MKWPSIKAQVDSELDKARGEIESKLVPSGPAVVRHVALSGQGHSLEWIDSEMKAMDKEIGDVNWKDGKLSGAVYHGGEDMEVGALLSSIKS